MNTVLLIQIQFKAYGLLSYKIGGARFSSPYLSYLSPILQVAVTHPDPGEITREQGRGGEKKLQEDTTSSICGEQGRKEEGKRGPQINV